MNVSAASYNAPPRSSSRRRRHSSDGNAVDLCRLPSLTLSSSSSMDPDVVAKEVRQAAIQVAQDFDKFSNLVNDARASMVAAFDPSELVLGSKPSSSPAFSSPSSSSKRSSNKSSSDTRFLWYRLKRIKLEELDESDERFDDKMEDHRERIMDWCEGDHRFSVKFVNIATLGKGIDAAREAAFALVLEAKTLANLPKHPHIAQIYGIHSLGPAAGFASQDQTESYFTIVDEISETLQERISLWRKQEKANKEDPLRGEQKQQWDISQRLEVVLDIVSALEWLGTQNLVFLFDPTKAGFDARMSRVKLFDFGHSVESGKNPSFSLDDADESYMRAYMAPAVHRGRKVTLSADVYAVG
ncbi:MAG: hypothetical protein SGILL_007653, partial [Bacillariaceae sp.]